ncbi:MraY family glycosyltransferase [Paenibacillus sp.]|jgi:UDP-N-acetylmuramyl pentapeptide phosphotransferase/UDP-N-acetylglucosamine-1-phosphate transferase|uniref:MraY family glycosyltransferase n=1 Tax=Paenibacillus sp. TaxID=58172 RepID=UPI00282905EE|nr:MraY family glycosyltransferase [Paenibacillus sp.]MDR0266960.1 undecaprenyl/decaprenyl-phosphate alpha-N-acetylglucosaminyl 1-phosphate transferase [Paenibacillus sp.]
MEVKIVYVIGFILSLVIVLALIPPLRKLAIRVDFVDRPTSRKIHKEPVPHLASIAIFLGFMIPYLILSRHWDLEMAGIIGGSLLILAIGMVDDWYKTRGKDFPALPKTIVQVAAAVIVYFSGISFVGVTVPFTGHMIVFPDWLQFILTILWIFGVTTVINFMDGLDGLSGGVAGISALTLFVVAIAKGQAQSAIMAIILVGVALGYLKYNKPPAKIYMGDAGATFIGFMLGIIALDGAFKQVTVISILVPVLALGVPIFDNIYVVIKRYLNGQPVYKADRSQIHYRLLSWGLSPKQAVLFIYLISVCLSLSSIILMLLSKSS